MWPLTINCFEERSSKTHISSAHGWSCVFYTLCIFFPRHFNIVSHSLGFLTVTSPSLFSLSVIPSPLGADWSPLPVPVVSHLHGLTRSSVCSPLSLCVLLFSNIPYVCPLTPFFSWSRPWDHHDYLKNHCHHGLHAHCLYMDKYSSWEAKVLFKTESFFGFDSQYWEFLYGAEHPSHLNL